MMQKKRRNERDLGTDHDRRDLGTDHDRHDLGTDRDQRDLAATSHTPPLRWPVLSNVNGFALLVVLGAHALQRSV